MTSETNYLVTVVIPTYNSEKFISETLNSVIKQITEFKYIIHISDDASTDLTKKICKDFQNNFEFIKIFSQKINLGMTKNQHFVIKSAKTKYVAYIDSDDIFKSKYYLQKQIDFLEKNKDVTCVFSNVELVDSQKSHLKYRFSGNEKPPRIFDLHYYFQNSVPITNSAMVFRNEFSNNIPTFYTEYFQYDWLLHIHHGLNGLFGYNDILGTQYRIHDSNATNIKFAEKKFKDAINLVYNIKTFIPNEYHIYFSHPKYEINRLAFYYLRYGKYIKFIFWYIKWLKVTPYKSISFRDQFWLFRESFFKRN